MGFAASYIVGGSVDELKKLHLPTGLFPDEDKIACFAKGFRLEIPAQSGVYSQDFLLPWDCHLSSASLVASGYSDGDFWELMTLTDSSGSVIQKYIETCYTKELPETVRLDDTFPVLPAGQVVRVEFDNVSGTSKTVWINLKFLHG